MDVQNVRANTYNPYMYNQGGDVNPQNRNFSRPFNPSGIQSSEVQYPQETNEGGPDGFSHQNLFDLIEKDIALELTSRIQNLDINSGQPGLNQPQDGTNGGFGTFPENSNPFLFKVF